MPSSFKDENTDTKTPSLRAFGDIKATRRLIYDNALSAAQAIEPVQSKTHTLKLSNVSYMDPDDLPPSRHKQAILGGETLGRRLKGVWELSDNASGKVLDRREQIVGRVPHLNGLGTFTLNGNDYVLRHQERLEPGAFTRIKNNGELETHVNILPGKGVSHRYMLDPAKGVFQIKLGQSVMPLMPLLEAMGVSNKELQDSWGNELFAANAQANDAGALRKLKEKLLRPVEGEEEASGRARLVQAFEGMEMHPEINQKTLGAPHARLDKDAILAITRKLLAVSRGEADPDDRDHLAYQRFFGPEDLFHERLRKDHGHLRRAWLFRHGKKGDLAAMPSGLLTPQIEQAILGSGLGSSLEEINPLEILDKHSNITKLGEGGLPCHSDDTEVFTLYGWKRWPDVVSSDKLATLDSEGRMIFEVPHRLFAVAYDGPMCRGVTKMVDYLVTPAHRMFVSFATTTVGHTHVRSEWQYRQASDIHGKNVKHLVGCKAYVGGNAAPEWYILYPAPVKNGNHGSARTESLRVPFLPWVQFLGYWLADGSYAYSLERKEYRTEVAKYIEKNPEEHVQIEDMLAVLGFTYRYEQRRRFIINGKHLAYYLKQLGFAGDKFVPDYVLAGDLVTRKTFFDAITTMDHSGDRDSRCFGYASKSKRLAEQVGWLALSLGYTVIYRLRRKKGEPPQHKLIVRTTREAGISLQKNRDQYQTIDYSGTVYCAEVSGSMLLTRRNGTVLWSGNSLDAVPEESRNVHASHMGFLDACRTPESFRAGIDLYLARGARKGADGKLYARFRNLKTGKLEWKTPQDIDESTVVASGVMQQYPTKLVPAFKNGKIEYVPRGEVTLEQPDFEDAFSHVSNLVPMKSGMKGQREVMASRMLTQALPLTKAEAPWVQSGIPGSRGLRSYEDEHGTSLGAVRASEGGRVTKVTPDAISVHYDSGKKDDIPLYNQFPFARKTFYHQSPIVAAGTPFGKGQLLATSNYTDNQGTAALGLNARVAYIPWEGLAFEDAGVISRSLADRLTSEHAYQHDLTGLPLDEKTKMGRKPFISLFPTKFTRQILDTIGDDGVIKPGTIVEHGQPLILAAREKEDAENKIHKRKQPGFLDASVIWEHHDPGVVTDVVHGKEGPLVVVKSRSPMKVGDKISGRHGNKHIISAILPDHQMPQDAEGKPIEAILGDMGITTRTNPAQYAEAMLGKIAAKTGRPYKVEDFKDIKDMAAYAEDELKKHGMESMEEVYLPKYDKKIKAGIGNIFLMKLHHQAESKLQGRGGGGYTAEGEPSKASKGGSKRVAMLDLNALLSHGAIENVRDVRLVRGREDPQFWLQMLSGHTPRDPVEPQVYHKFLAMLKGAGMNPVRHGSQLHLMALTDKDVSTLSQGRYLENGETVHFDQGLKPVAGGLFDPNLTGGHGADKWSAIKLHEPLPSPVMEEPLRKVLGLTEKKLRGVIAGTEELGEHGTGPQALVKALDDFSLPRALAQARMDIAGGSKTRRSEAERKLGYLIDAERLGLHPRDWMLSHVPVLPPIFRPVSMLGATGTPLVADSNYLYKELMGANNNLKEMKGLVGEGNVGDERLAVYDALKAVTGLGEPITLKNQQKRIKGLLGSVFSSSPKFGMMQRKLLSSTVDNVGRGVVIPNPDLDMDHLGIPENMAFDIYSKFVARRLHRRGLPLREALKQIKERTPLARSYLTEEMAARPVYMNRAPVLHRFGIMAFHPVLVGGNVIQVPPFIVKGFGMDFDGDAVNIHVPTTDKAIHEAMERMLPSKNLLSPADFKTPMAMPIREYLYGLYHATSKNNKRRPSTFRGVDDVLAALAHGSIRIDDPVETVT
jgi:DNA-directed RNA polymerase beta subunit